MNRRKCRFLIGMLASAIAVVVTSACNGSTQSAMPPDDPDMALKLAFLDEVEPSEASQYVTLMDELNQACVENRAMIGGISKGIADIWLEQYGQEMTMLEGMEILQGYVVVHSPDRSAVCTELFTRYRRDHGDIE